MTLRADAVTAPWIELAGVDDAIRTLSGPHAGGMASTRPVATFTADSRIEEGRIGKAVLGPGHGLQPAGMALQTPCPYGSRQVDAPVLPVSGRKVPFASVGVIRYWSLVEEPVERGDVAPRDSARADEPSQKALAAYSGLNVRELQPVSLRGGHDAVLRAERRVGQSGAIEILPEFPCPHRAAAERHAGS